MFSTPIPKLFLLILNCIFGYLPSLIFLFWLERHCALPWFPKLLQWPWVFIENENLMPAFFNLGLFISLGALCLFSLRFLGRLKLISVGVACFFVMSFWQPTGVVFYQIIPHPILATLVSFLIFGVCFYFLIDTRKRIFGALMLLISPQMTLDRVLVCVGLMVLLYLTQQFLKKGFLKNETTDETINRVVSPQSPS